MNIYCGDCKKALDKKDQVILSVMNCLSHPTCYYLGPNLIKDIGEYGEIIEKYWFFQEQTH